MADVLGRRWLGMDPAEYCEIARTVVGVVSGKCTLITLQARYN
jgi:hypothetical protein